ncbi:MAG TPA: hypothetical protein VG937_31060 [Polyangiaceae bacterium]|nr:hypothetical protein [Polyangiaceae bacterium]
MRALPALATLALLSSTLSSPALARPCQSALPEAGASARLGFAPAGFGSVPEACPVTDSSLQGTASALLAFDDFYGLLEAGVAPRFRRRLFDSDWVSLWLPSLEYRFSANATIEAHTLGLGDAAVGYHHALAVNQRLVLTPYLRVLYPFDTGYRNATRYGFEHGLSASLLLSPRIELVGGLAFPAFFTHNGGRVLAVFVPSFETEAVLSPTAWLGIVLGAGVRVRSGKQPGFESFDPRAALRLYPVSGLRIELAAAAPLWGGDRTDLLLGLNLGWLFLDSR